MALTGRTLGQRGGIAGPFERVQDGTDPGSAGVGWDLLSHRLCRVCQMSKVEFAHFRGWKPKKSHEHPSLHLICFGLNVI